MFFVYLSSRFDRSFDIKKVKKINVATISCPYLTPNIILCSLYVPAYQHEYTN